MFERLTSIEVEDEEGNVSVLRIRRATTSEVNDPQVLRSKDLLVRPGGMMVAADLDLRAVTTPDEAIADAHKRADREYAEMRERGSAARTGGEQAMQPGEVMAPRHRPRRGAKGTQAEASGQQPAEQEGAGTGAAA